MEQRKYQVYGELIIPIYFPIYDKTKQRALERISTLISSRSICKLDGDICMLDGRTYPIVASKVNVQWLEALSDDEL